MSPEPSSTARSPSEIPERGSCVLVADDDRAAREQLAALLRNDGHTVEMCEDGAEALGRVAQGGIDLVLLDVMMPKISGTEACRLLKGMNAGTFLPVILVTAKNDASSRAEGLRMGADDYVGKPFDPDELSARVASMLRIRRLIGNLTEDRERLLKRAVHDDLTGLPNRRHFEARLAEERKRAERHHEPFACLVIDVSAAIAAREGRGPGVPDRTLARAAAALKRSVREGDVVARVSEGAFGAMLPHTHFPGTIAASERILRDVAGAIGDLDGSLESVAIGASLFPSRDGRTPEALLAAAENALHEARRAGGGCICILQQRKYIYTPSATPAPRSEPPPPSRRAGLSAVPDLSTRAPSEPPDARTDPRSDARPGDADAEPSRPSLTDLPRDPTDRRG